jgi:hypothetical protein
MATRGGESLGAQHRGGRLLGGLQRARPSAGWDLETVAVNGVAVGVLSLHEDKADGGWCHRQAEYGVHLHPFGRPRVRVRLPVRCGTGEAGTANRAPALNLSAKRNVLCHMKLLQIMQRNICRISHPPFWPRG